MHVSVQLRRSGGHLHARAPGRFCRLLGLFPVARTLPFEPVGHPLRLYRFRCKLEIDSRHTENRGRWHCSNRWASPPNPTQPGSPTPVLKKSECYGTETLHLVPELEVSGLEISLLTLWPLAPSNYQSHPKLDNIAAISQRDDCLIVLASAIEAMAHHLL